MSVRTSLRAAMPSSSYDIMIVTEALMETISFIYMKFNDTKLHSLS